MFKIIQITFLCLLLANCHQNSSYVSRYGQSIVLNPTEAQLTSDKKLKSLILKKTSSKKSLSLKKTEKITHNINFSSTKFLKGNADCIEIIRVKVTGSLTYDELMAELKKRAATLGGNAVGITDLNEKQETTFTTQRTKKNHDDKFINNLIKESLILSSVTADIFKCVP